MSAPASPKLWSWVFRSWVNAGAVGGGEDWSSVQEFPVGADATLHRVIYRAGGWVNYFADFEPPPPRPASGAIDVQISTRYGELGDRTVIYQMRHPYQYSLGWAFTGLEGGQIYWAGVIPPIEVDIDVRRAAGVEDVHELVLEVDEFIVNDASFSPTLTPWPASRLDSYLWYLIAEPPPPLLT